MYADPFGIRCRRQPLSVLKQPKPMLERIAASSRQCWTFRGPGPGHPGLDIPPTHPGRVANLRARWGEMVVDRIIMLERPLSIQLRSREGQGPSETSRQHLCQRPRDHSIPVAPANRVDGDAIARPIQECPGQGPLAASAVAHGPDVPWPTIWPGTREEALAFHPLLRGAGRNPRTSLGRHAGTWRFLASSGAPDPRTLSGAMG